MNIPYLPICFGADPEFFFSKNGSVIGAEKVLPKEGVRNMIRRYKTQNNEVTGNLEFVTDKKGERIVEEVPESNHKFIIIDGVQAEFNFFQSFRLF